MNIKIFIDRHIEKDYFNNEGTQNENYATILNFEIPEELNNYNKRIVFITENGNHWDLIKDNQYIIPLSIAKYKKVQAYLWFTKDDIDFRTKLFELSFNYNENADDIIPSEEELDGFNTLIDTLNEKIEEVDILIEDFSNLKGIPKGGNKGQVLGKKSDEDFDVSWMNQTGGGSSGTNDYNDLKNKPSIAGIELEGNKTLDDLGIQPKGKYLSEEEDPTVPEVVKKITSKDIQNWNDKSNFSGKYEDLIGKPTIPSKTSDLINDTDFITDEELPTVYNWDGKSSIENPNNLKLWQKIINKSQEQVVLVYSSLETLDNPRYNSVFIISPSRITIQSKEVKLTSMLNSVINNSNPLNGIGLLFYYPTVQIKLNELEVTDVSDIINSSLASLNWLPTNGDIVQSYTPTYDYHPTPKKYVDDIVGNINSILDAINGEVIGTEIISEETPIQEVVEDVNE